MKRIIVILAIALLPAFIFAQSPEKMGYQAVIRNSGDYLVANQQVGMQISILQNSLNGIAVYVETQTPTTNKNGLLSIEIGEGTVQSGSIANIDWSNGPYYIKTEIDLAGGNNYTITSTSQLISVPYAFHAKTVEIDQVNDADADPENEIQTLTLAGQELSLSKNGGKVILPKPPLWTENETDDAYRLGGKIGIDTDSPEFKLTLGQNGSILAKGTFGEGDTLTTAGEGTRLIWYPRKSAFRAGTVLSDKWDDANIGDFSFASGADNKASGSSSTALGQLTLASGNVSTSMGLLTKAESYVSTAIGVGNVGGGSPESWVETDPLFEIGNSLDNQNPSNALTVLKNGNVGIGAHNPEHLLHLNGYYGASLLIQSEKDYPSIEFKHALNSYSLNYSDNGFNINFNTLNNQTSSLLTLTMDGKLGINNRYPSQKLDVNSGNIIIRGTNGSKINGDQGILYLGTVHHYILGEYGYGVKIGTYAVSNALNIKERTGRIGIGTDQPEFKLSLEEDGGIIAKGDFDSGASLSTSGTGTRLIWYPKKAAFRAGNVLSDNWDDENIGIGSFASGFDTEASGTFSTAMGGYSKATSRASSSFGYLTIASGLYSTVIGSQSTAKGDYSVSIGFRTISEAFQSTAIGSYNVGGGNPTQWIDTDPLFEIGNSEFGTPKSNALTVLKNGNVGIGTNIPAGKLDVNGSIFQRGGVLHADYVFEPDYNLETIEDHARYMWENKHLEAIPKATVDNEGKEIIEIGSHQKGIVEELEKAHIYIEQLNDRVKYLESRLEELTKSKQNIQN